MIYVKNSLNSIFSFLLDALILPVSQLQTAVMTL